MLATRFSRTATTRNAAGHSGLALSEDDLRRFTPSVFAEAPHESRSARYAYIPTIEVLRGLFANGFRVYSATQANCRDSGKTPYTKHMLRLRHESSIEKAARVGDTVNEVVLLNAHDGTSAWQMMGGVHRFICANGMVVGSMTTDIRVKHSGKVLDEVVEGAITVMDSFDEIDASKDAFKSLQLTSGEQTAFANAAIAMRFGVEKEPPVQAAQVIQPRRYEDQENSLWNTFQRAQEHLVQGGLRTNDRTRRTRTRAITGIDGNVALNRGLWVLAEEMRKIRNAA